MLCADLRACAAWRGLADELLLGQYPSTVLGIEHREWVDARGG